MSNKKFQIIKVENEDQIEKLRAFKELLNCQGPSGRIKSITTPGGYSLYTSSSRRILQYIEISDSLLVFITQFMKSHLGMFNDFGLYAGQLTASLLENSYLIMRECSYRKVQEALATFLDQIHQILNSPLLKIEFDLSSIHQIFPLIRGIIESKSAIQFSKSECENLTWKLIKCAIERIENVEEISVRCDTEVGEQITSCPGVLYSWTKEHPLFEHSEWTLIIFDIMLDDINQEQALLDLVERLKINLLVSQKVVHSELQFLLRRRRVLVLERMGSELTKSLCKMTGLEPISEINNIPNIQVVGSLSSLKLVSYGSRDYINLEANNKFITLLVPAKNEEASIELQIVCNQALSTLQLFLRQSYIIFGGGCAETRLLALLNQRISLDSIIEKSLFVAFIKSLLYPFGILLTHEFDTLMGHLWTDSSHDRCRCQIVSAEDIRMYKKTWRPIDDLENFANSFKLQEITKNFIPLSSSLIDLHRSKCSAIENSIQTTSQLLEIGMIIDK